MRAVVLAVVTALAFAGCEGARESFIPERVSCRDCRIVMEEIAVIADTTEERMLTGRPTSVWVDSRGRDWISVLDAFPMLYEPATQRLEQFGRRGRGPMRMVTSGSSRRSPGRIRDRPGRGLLNATVARVKRGCRLSLRATSCIEPSSR